MVQVKSFFLRYSLRTGSISVLSLYLVLGLSFYIGEQMCLKGNFTFVSIVVLASVVAGTLSCVIGLVGVFVNKASLLLPILCLKFIFFLTTTIVFIYSLFENKFPLSKLIEDLAQANKGVFVILYLMSLGLGVYFWIVIYSYYMKKLKEGTPPVSYDMN